MARKTSRREQILNGIAIPSDRWACGSLPSGHNRRREPRLVCNPAGRLRVGTRSARLTNFSGHGLQIVAELELGVGDSVQVHFAGRAIVGARIAWRRANRIGLLMQRGFEVPVRPC